MKTPKISIIVPIYNVEQYLDRCLSSLVNQTLKDIEIILVDDGSPDKCPQMCDEYAKIDSRIKVIHKKNAGLGYARNSGIETASGEYIAFVDSDDYVDVKTYEKLLQFANNNKCDAVFCGFKIQTPNGKWISSNEVIKDTIWTGQEINTFMLNMIASGARVKKERLYQMSVWHAIYRRSIITSNNILFPSEREVVSEDIPFQVDFLTNSDKIGYIKDCLYSYCFNSTSLSATFNPNKFIGYCKLRECLLSKCDKHEYKNRVNRLFVGYTRAYCYRINKYKKYDLYTKIFDNKTWKSVKKEFKPSYLPLHLCIIYMLMSKNSINILNLFINATRKFRK